MKLNKNVIFTAQHEIEQEMWKIVFVSLTAKVTEGKTLVLFFMAMVLTMSVFSSPCQRQRELLPSLGIRHPLTFHILIST
jgi:hypothetical protein